MYGRGDFGKTWGVSRKKGTPFVFRRYAGSLQLRLRTFEDLLRLAQVPEALWVATACPITGLACDTAFLTHLDTDANGRVRARQLHRAVEWTGRMLADRSACVPGSEVLTLAHLSTEAAPLRAAADAVLTACEATDRSQVSLEQVRKLLWTFAPPPPPANLGAAPGGFLPLFPGTPGAAPPPFPGISGAPPPFPGTLGAPPFPSPGTTGSAPLASSGTPGVPPPPFPGTPGGPPPPFPTFPASLSVPAPPVPPAAPSVLPSPVLAPPAPAEAQAPVPSTHAELTDEQRHIVELERLILYQQWLFSFANNFAALPDLYSVERRALFEQGTLIMAGREFTLSVLVTDRASHAALAAQASMYILYCAITGGQPSRNYTVAVPVTSGTTRGLFVGKRGIFRDLEGHEYDAQVLQIIQQPVSLYEAATAPFRRIAHFFTTRIEAWSMASDTEFEARLTQTTQQVLPTHLASTGAPTGAPLPTGYPLPGGAPQPPPYSYSPLPASAASTPALAGTTGLLVGGSVAVAALGSALAFIIHQLRAITLLEFIFAVVALCAAAMVPALLLAFIRIYNRDLAVVLEGAGWAMNDRLRLTRRLGKLFTRKPKRPRGSRIDTRDQVEEALLRLVEVEEGRTWALLIRPLKFLAFALAVFLLIRFHAEIVSWVTQFLTTRLTGTRGPSPP